MDSWIYEPERRTAPTATPCQEEQCSQMATYTLHAKKGEHGQRVGGRNYCTNHCAAACLRLHVPFPPNSPRKVKGGRNG